MTAASQDGPNIKWYRVPLPQDEFRKLTKRSDFMGFLQSGGFLAIYAGTALLALYSLKHFPWWATVLLVFLHGTVQSFVLNGFHELCHNTVFKTRWINEVFLRIYSFLGWHNYVYFQESHRRHHRYTLHPEGDQEVVLPITYTLKAFLKVEFINIRALYMTPKMFFNVATGKMKTIAWRDRILPLEGPSRRREYIQWARITLIGHSLIIIASLLTGYWLVPILITFSYAYGGWLRFLCNETQHVGLCDKVPDYRLCCRTIYLNPIVRFLYWHMNYHTEHHMYASVPCYKLGRLHKLMKSQLPPVPHGLIATWRHIAAILKRQKSDPAYQYKAPLPQVEPA